MYNPRTADRRFNRFYRLWRFMKSTTCNRLRSMETTENIIMRMAMGEPIGTLIH
jgi:hypothetical protein